MDKEKFDEKSSIENLDESIDQSASAPEVSQDSTETKGEGDDGAYHIHRTTRLYRDAKVQLENAIGIGCAIDSDLYSRGKETSQHFRQAEDIVLIKLTEDEMKGNLDELTQKHLVTAEELSKLIDENGYVTLEKMMKNGINALFTDHTRIGKLDFVDIDHIASEIRRINSYCYRHDSTTEDPTGIDTSGPTAWKLVGINLNLETSYWESKEEYHHQNFFQMLAMKSIK